MASAHSWSGLNRGVGGEDGRGSVSAEQAVHHSSRMHCLSENREIKQTCSGELLLFIWALFLTGSIFFSVSPGELIAQILQSRSFILQPCQCDKATCVGMNATGFQVPKDKLCSFKN